jgi:hypothetical protein
MTNLRTITRAILVLSSVLLLSCDDPESAPERPTPGDYFPLDPAHTWEYVTVHRYHGTGFGAGTTITDTVRLAVTESPGEWENRYFTLSDQHGQYYSHKWIRKDGYRFFERPPYAYEYMFLDTDTPVNGIWTEYPYGSRNKIVFLMKAVNTVKTVNGIRYHHVIEIVESHYAIPDGENQYTLHGQTRHYYAKDVGKIYSYQEYGTDGEGGTIEVTLLKHTR